MKGDAVNSYREFIEYNNPIQSPMARDQAPSVFAEIVQSDRDLFKSGSALIQAVIDGYESSAAVLNKDQRILYVNRAWRQFASRFGTSAERSGDGHYLFSGHATTDMAKSDAAEIEAGIAKVICKHEIDFRTEYRCTAMPEPQWFRLHAASLGIADKDGGPMVLVCHEDITREKAATDLLEKDRQRLERLLDSTRILPWEADAESGELTYVGEQADRIFGYPLKQWYERGFKFSHIHPDDRSRTIAEWTSLSQSSDQFQLEYRIVTADGRELWVNDIVSVHRQLQGPSSISGFMIDITDRKQAERALILLSGRLLTAQEDERKRIARELHDDLNQRIALLSIELAQVSQMLSNEPNGVSERVKELQKKAIGISEDVHRMSHKLHPSKLDHLGLIPALRSFCIEVADHSGVRINFNTVGTLKTLPSDITLCLFRVAQEALQNSVKHSGTREIDVTVGITEDVVNLDLSDSGCGFDMASGKMIEGLGFTSMAERLNLVGGFFEVRSRPLAGTQIEASVPLTGRHE